MPNNFTNTKRLLLRSLLRPEKKGEAAMVHHAGPRPPFSERKNNTSVGIDRKPYAHARELAG